MESELAPWNLPLRPLRLCVSAFKESIQLHGYGLERHAQSAAENEFDFVAVAARWGRLDFLNHFHRTLRQRFEKCGAVAFRQNARVEDDDDPAVLLRADEPPDALAQLQDRLGQ